MTRKVVHLTVSMTDAAPFGRLTEFVSEVENYSRVTADEGLGELVTQLMEDLREIARRAQFCVGCGEKMPDADEGAMCVGVPDVGVFHPECFDTWEAK